ncbi:PLP-dependent aminotransferase family protein [Mesorhizobium sp.]|uniref:aminotransferase-like domain-containing protein n=1 Tax=Mesorhizobium sp. TaxID=1871066 RepID=UPI000FE722EA|nr:PLP-dependent aminotransferase family protein [Mesorhizobium sp.]RWO86175.1 MAG: PLP-dependent aminotransferase family protein [Mesorhizobium sp.]
MTRAEAVAAEIRRRIETGSITVGAKLPSIRKAAEQFYVSKNTIVDAYDRLVSAGIAFSRPGAGFMVAERRRQTPSERPRHVAEAVDIASLLNAQLEESFSIRVGDGRPPASWMEESEVRRHLGLLGRHQRSSSDGYGSAMGLPALRERLAFDLMEREVQASPDQILLTFGANHALDLIIRRFLVAGDTVLVDDPGYYPLFAKLKLAQIRMIGVKRTPTGPDLDDLAGKAERERPKLFFTQSLAHNPTGSSTNLPTAHSILTIAARCDMLVVEDDPFVDLPTVRGVGLAPLDQLRNVICVRTFAKTLSASLRCGYIAARPDLIASLAELKMLTTVNSSGHIERLIHGLISEGHYRRHLKRLAQRVQQATETVVPRLQKMGLKLFAEPTGGYYVYLELPEYVDDIALAREGARQGIFIAPGTVFSPERQSAKAGIRVNIAWASDPHFFDFMLAELRHRRT